MPVVAIYIDVKQAFDSVKDKILLTRLEKYGFDIDFLTHMDSYLFNRRQCVKLDYSLSLEIPVTSGVTQGSVFGPLHFTLFINDIDDNLESSNYLLYCGYLKILSSAETELGQDDRDVLFSWASFNSRTFHPSKFSLLSFNYTFDSLLTFANDSLTSTSRNADWVLLLRQIYLGKFAWMKNWPKLFRSLIFLEKIIL